MKAMRNAIIGWVVIVLCSGGCSVIVRNKLEDNTPAPDTGATNDMGLDGITGVTVTGEAKRDYYIIGERITIGDPSQSLKGEPLVLFESEDGKVKTPCPGAWDESQHAYICAIPSWTREGPQRLLTKDDVRLGPVLTIKRMLLAGGPRVAKIFLLDAETLEPMKGHASIDLGGPIATTGQPLLAPSGRYLLLLVEIPSQGSNLVLVDLVLGQALNLEMHQDPFYQGQGRKITPHSFEPILFQRPIPDYPLEAVFYQPEEWLWVVAEGEKIFKVNIAQSFANRKVSKEEMTFAGLLHVANIHQVLWVPDYQNGKFLAGVSSNGAFFWKPGPDSKPVASIIDNLQGQCLQISHAVPWNKGQSKPMNEPIFLVLCEKNRPEDTDPIETNIYGYRVINSGTKVDKAFEPTPLSQATAPFSMVTIPGTGLVGLSTDQNPNDSNMNLFLSAASDKGPFALEAVTGILKTGKVSLASYPGKYFHWEILVKRPETADLLVFENDSRKTYMSAATPKSSMLSAVHHPYQDAIFGLSGSQAFVISYSSNPAQPNSRSLTIPTADFPEGGGLFLQP
jgi:hypothetical protein